MILTTRFFTRLKKIQKIKKRKSPNMNNSDESDRARGEEGMTYATLIVSVLSIFVLISVIGFFLWHIRQKDEEFKLLLHKNEEKAAYKFTWVKNQLNLMTTACRAKAERIEQWQKWAEQNTAVKPPINLLTGQNQADCSFASEMSEMPEGEK